MAHRSTSTRFKCDAGLVSFDKKKLGFRFKSGILVRLVVAPDKIRLKLVGDVARVWGFSIDRILVDHVRLARLDAGGFDRAVYLGVHLDAIGQVVMWDGTIHPTAFILGADDASALKAFARRSRWPLRELSTVLPSPMTGPAEVFLRPDLE